MYQHVAKVSAACFNHLSRLRQIRCRVGQAVVTRLVLAMITSRLDYCNSVLAGLPQSTLEPLQKVQNCAARLIFIWITTTTSPMSDPITLVTSLSACAIQTQNSVHWCTASTTTGVRRISLTSFNPPRRRQHAEVYVRLNWPTTFCRGCVPSLQSEVSPTRDQPRETAYPSRSAEHRPMQPSNDN